ncbi:hypothetical protein [Formosa sp. S-31]|uniref:hypothetical protein n=1 Tax=Formosa sp. S-31 TaxID=2790949 RepID=UPI003EBCE335
MVFSLTNCEDTYVPELNYVTFEVDPPLVSVLKESATSIDLAVYSSKVLGSDRTFDIIINEGTSLNPASYNVPSTVTIPANTNEGIITVTFSDDNLGESLETLVLDLNVEGENIYSGNSISVDVQKKCPLDGIEALAGTYAVTFNASGYDNGFTATVNDDSSLVIDGLSQDFITYFWAEPVVSGGKFTMNVNLETGAIEIPRQYIYTTTYEGAEYQYEIEGSGKWSNCGNKPTMTLEYDIYYPGDSEGLGETYSGYLTNGYLGGTFTLE